MIYSYRILFVLSVLMCCVISLSAQRENDSYDQVIIRGATLVNGNGAPPMGPVDIVIDNNKITKIVKVGYPNVAINQDRRPKAKNSAKEIDAHDMYVLPGFIDMHGHIGSIESIPEEYVFKLWMAHGITTVREPGSFRGRDWTLDLKKKSSKNEITAPRIVAYTGFGMGTDGINSPEEAVKWVKENAEAGSDGIKFFGARPDIMQAALEENKRLGLGSACHHAQTDVTWVNVLNSSGWGLTTMEHWYGLPEAMFHNKIIQHYPADYNYQNEQQRFEEAGKLWEQAAEPGSDKWNEVMNTLLERDFTLDPTFNIYEANRDLMRARTADWHRDYTLPAQWDFYAPSRISHGSYWHAWGTTQEVSWKNNYRLWMQFVNEFKNRGGRVTTGSDSGYIYQLYGFAYIRELELLQEAGFHPLEVIRSATLMGAEALGMDDQIGSIEVGKLADLVIVEENPVADLKVLYGTGTIRLSEDNEVVRTKGVKYTIKDGIVYDSRALLKDIREMVIEAKKTDGETEQPGYPNWD